MRVDQQRPAVSGNTLQQVRQSLLAAVAGVDKKTDALAAAVAALTDDETNIEAAIAAAADKESALVTQLQAELADTRAQLLSALTQISGEPGGDGGTAAGVTDGQLAAAFRAAADKLDPPVPAAPSA